MYDDRLEAISSSEEEVEFHQPPKTDGQRTTEQGNLAAFLPDLPKEEIPKQRDLRHLFSSSTTELASGKRAEEDDFCVHKISSDEHEYEEEKVEKPTSLWMGEPKKWQNITAADFEEVHELSDTDDEFDSDSQRVVDSKFWCQSIVPTKYYIRGKQGAQVGTEALKGLQFQFAEKVLNQLAAIKELQPRSDPPELPNFHTCSTCTHANDDGSSDSCSSDDDSSSSSDGSSSRNSSNFDSDSHSLKRIKRRKCANPIDEKSAASRKIKRKKPNEQLMIAKQSIERKQTHPAGLHPDLCFNEPGQVNDGPFCKCSWTAKQTGVRHNKFAGERPIPKCDYNENNIDRLHHYVLKILPNPNKFTRRPTTICVDGVSYVFDGFSVFFHQPLPDVFPQTQMNQWNAEFSVNFEKENSPESFTIKDLEIFHLYLFDFVMEMYDWNRMPSAVGESCPFYHALPRFIRVLEDEGKEILPMSTVIKHFTEAFVPFIDDEAKLQACRNPDFVFGYGHSKKGQLFVNPSKRPMCIRVDLVDHSDVMGKASADHYPIFTHFGTRPSAYAYNGKPEYQRALKRFIKLRHLLFLKSNKHQLSADDRQRLRDGEQDLKRLRYECKTKRDITVSVSSRGFYETGLYPDVVQHAMFLILACSHARFHWSLRVYEEERIQYKFKNRILLELALTHPSHRCNYGTNSDHAKNTLNNCGILFSKGQLNAGGAFNNAAESGGGGRKRGINALMEIMSMQGSKKSEKLSSVHHNERLEFLGDAVVEFITTVHLFFLFPELEEGGLATYRSALVQNKHLALLAKKIGLHEFMLYAHGPDLCHESDLRHAMANAFEAMMAAVFLDSNINECDRIFSRTLFGGEEELFQRWVNLPEHPLKTQNPFGDRHIIERVPCLKELEEFESAIGIRFKHIRLLAKAFTRRNIAYNYLTHGHNQRLEFLGDTVLQLITTDYLYKHFPHHQEGHLSLLRTCLVSNKTQSVICDDLAMQKYLVIPKVMERSGKGLVQLRVKDKADLVESFIGALYVDRGLQYCKLFCRVCFFPRLKYFILTQRWNDPKSQLQQCCLTLRQPESGDPDIPEYKTIGVEGPTNTRIYRVAVYFRNKRLAEGVGNSVQLAQMQAAENALVEKAELFPSFDFRNTYLGAREECPPESVDARGRPTTNPMQRRKRKRHLTAALTAGTSFKKRRDDDRDQPYRRSTDFTARKGVGAQPSSQPRKPLFSAATVPVTTSSRCSSVAIAAANYCLKSAQMAVSTKNPCPASTSSSGSSWSPQKVRPSMPNTGRNTKPPMFPADGHQQGYNNNNIYSNIIPQHQSYGVGEKNHRNYFHSTVTTTPNGSSTFPDSMGYCRGMDAGDLARIMPPPPPPIMPVFGENVNGKSSTTPKEPSVRFFK